MTYNLWKELLDDFLSESYSLAELSEKYDMTKSDILIAVNRL